MTPEFWADRTVLVTGHTGFKGAWLCAWLDQVGARLSGYSLAPEGEHNLWTSLKMGDRVASTIADINDAQALRAVIDTQQPEIIFHFAAQSLVRRSYRDPVDTFAANVIGPFLVIRALRLALAKAGQARIAILSSRMGSNAHAGGNAFIYRASKAAVTNLASNLALELAGDGISVGAYHPGWVRTDMGGDAADLDVATSAKGLMTCFAALSPATSGCFQSYDGTVLGF